MRPIHPPAITPFPLPLFAGLILILVSIPLAPHPLPAQTNSASSIKFIRLSSEHGLSQSRVTAVAQDTTGFIWIGTADGLNRFDGYEALNFLSSGAASSLPNNFIQALLTDADGTLWVGTKGGLARSTDGGRTFEVFRHNESDVKTLSGNSITVIFKSREGVLCIGTESGGLNRFNAAQKTFTRSGRMATASAGDSITALAEDAKGKLWIGTTSGVFTLQGDDLVRPKGESGNFLEGETITAIAPANDGMLYVGTAASGLMRLNPNTGSMPLRYGSILPGRTDDEKITALAFGEKGELWVGTGGAGLLHFNPKQGPESWRTGDARELSDGDVTSLFQSRSGLMWVGTATDGISRFEPQSGERFAAIAIDHDHPDPARTARVRDEVTAICELQISVADRRTGQNKNKPTLLIGTSTGGLYTFGRAGFAMRLTLAPPAPKSPATAAKKSKSKTSSKRRKASSKKTKATKGKSVAASERKAALKNTPPKNAPPKSEMPSLGRDAAIYSIIQTAAGNVWIGAASGLYRYDASVNDTLALSLLHFRHTESNRSLPAAAITAIHEDAAENLWLGTAGVAGTAGGLYRLSKSNQLDTVQGGKFEMLSLPPSLAGSGVTAIVENTSTVWIGTENGLCKTTDGGKTFTLFTAGASGPNTLSGNRIASLCLGKSGALWIGTSGGLCRTTDGGATFAAYREKDGLRSDDIRAVLADDQGDLWLSTRRGLARASADSTANGAVNGDANDSSPVLRFRNYDGRDGLKLVSFNAAAAGAGNGGALYFGGKGWVHRFVPAMLEEKTFVPPVVITDFKLFNLSQPDKLGKRQIELSYKENYLSFEYAALSFGQPDENEYAYKLDGIDKEWVNAGSRREATYNGIRAGDYIFHVKAANRDGVWNEAGASVLLTIPPPVWERPWFWPLIGFAAFGFTATGATWGYKRRVRLIQQRNSELEDQVIKRTAELRERNTEIEERNRELDEKNQSITQSISYARTIQQAVLPDNEKIRAVLPEFFILYRPKDIVSGDFYWMHDAGEAVIIAVADCTGHGVPGGFMSMIGDSLLGQIIIEKNITDPALVLEELHKGVRRALGQTDDISSGQDGMDIALCRIEKKSAGGLRRVDYAGGKRPLYYVEKGGLVEVKGDKFSIGGWHREADRKFTRHPLVIQNGAMLYLTSDGFADQPDTEMRVFAAKRLREILERIAAQGIAAQHTELEQSLVKHQGAEAQRDDITVMGIRVRITE